MEDENSGNTIVRGTSCRVANVPPLVLQFKGLSIKAKPEGTCPFLISVLLQPVSINTLGNFLGCAPLTLLTRADISVVNFVIVVGSSFSILRSFHPRGNCIQQS